MDEPKNDILYAIRLFADKKIEKKVQALVIEVTKVIPMNNTFIFIYSSLVQFIIYYLAELL
jgi:hypothetical protein